MKKLLTAGSPTPEPEIPGVARDDVDRLKTLWLRANDRDQAVGECEVKFVQKGAKWRVYLAFSAAGDAERVSVGEGPSALEVLRAEVERLSRRLVLRARSDLAALQLCGVPFTPFDAPGDGAVEPEAGRGDDEHEFFVVRFLERKDYRGGRGPHPERTPQLAYARRWRTRERAARDEAALGLDQSVPANVFEVVPARRGVDYVYPPVEDAGEPLNIAAG